jgi:hypothetical protein
MRLLFCFLFVCSFASAQQFAAPCKEVPALNQAIVDVLKPYIGKKIARGECWDAAELALNKVNAEWDGLHVFGRAIDITKECIQPGDIVQFEEVEMEVKTENGGYSESFYHHTAIVYTVKGPGDLQFIHQNTGQFGRKMGVTDFNLANKTKGTMTFYRPMKKA